MRRVRTLASSIVVPMLTHTRENASTTSSSGPEALPWDEVPSQKPSSPHFVDLSAIHRTREYLELLATSELIVESTDLVNDNGNTLFEPLLDDVAALDVFERDGAPLDKWISDAIVSKLARVATSWLQNDALVLRRSINTVLHLKRMHVLRRVEGLVTNPRCCAVWSTLGLVVATLTDQRRHDAGLWPLVWCAPSLNEDVRLHEARGRLTVRVKIKTILVEAQLRDSVNVNSEMLVLAVWASTVNGLKLFVVQLNKDMTQRLASKEPSAVDEIAIAAECKLLAAVQVPSKLSKSLTKNDVYPPLLLLHNDVYASKEFLRSNASNRLFHISSIDSHSQGLLDAIHRQVKEGWLLKTPFEGGLAVGLILF